MSPELHVAYRLVAGRVHTVEDPALRRTVELARSEQRRARRAARRATR